MSVGREPERAERAEVGGSPPERAEVGGSPPERAEVGVSPGGKATATAPANIAFVKYWGARDVDRGLPLNPSISMTLSRCVTRCTVELVPEEGEDEVYLADAGGALSPAPAGFARPVVAHLERIRRWAGRRGRFRAATRNSFPSGTGLASSASGFAALTVAASRAAGRRASALELSDLARRSGSGSAARSLLGGYVEWPGDPGAWADGPGTVVAGAAGGREPEGEDGEVAAARPLASPEHWDLRDVIAVVETRPKAVSSREAHARVLSSPYFEARLRLLGGRLETVRRAVADRDFGLLWPVLEAEGLDLHLLAMSSRPPIFYWTPATLAVLEGVRELRREGAEAGWTMDAGPNVHVICPGEWEETVAEQLASLPGVRSVIRDRVGPGPRLHDRHLL